MSTQNIVQMYKEHGLQKVISVAVNHTQIDVEVQMRMQEPDFTLIMESSLYSKIWDAMPEMDPETRTREQMINAIATLEVVAACLRDEVADKQYNDYPFTYFPKP